MSRRATTIGVARAPAPARRRLAAIAAIAALGVATALAIWLLPLARGYLLFNGQIGLEARILGGVALSASASACVNCHDGAASGGPRAIARLDRTMLSTPRTPRGGAPVSYDEASFCRLLRSGVDPASVMVGRLMPRFSISDTDCAALFAYASRRS